MDSNDIINLLGQGEETRYTIAMNYTTTRYHGEEEDASNMPKEMNICHLV